MSTGVCESVRVRVRGRARARGGKVKSEKVIYRLVSTHEMVKAHRPLGTSKTSKIS